MNRPDHIPTLKTRRLVLRAPVIGDADRIVAVITDEAVVRWLAQVPWPYDRSNAMDWIAGAGEGVRARDEYAFAIDHDDRLIGMITLRGAGPEMNTGFWLDRKMWGMGLMTEAAEAVIAFGFKTLGLDAITSGVFEGNEASLAVQRKLGFTETGESLVHSLYYDRNLRHIDTRLSRNGYENTRS